MARRREKFTGGGAMRGNAVGLGTKCAGIRRDSGDGRGARRGRLPGPGCLGLVA